MHEAWQQITQAPKKQESIPHFNIQVLIACDFEKQIYRTEITKNP